MSYDMMARDGVELDAKYKRLNNRNEVRSRLLKKHSESLVGLWRIHGEVDCNTSLPIEGPFLTYAQGMWPDVLEFALHMDGFFTYGRGGTIELVDPVVAVPRKYAEQREGLLEQLSLSETALEMAQREVEQYKKLLGKSS